jgi:glutamyl-tRNA synthetase
LRYREGTRNIKEALFPMTNPAIRVRFAPSPTGYLHVGGARTALFNWLFARHFGGTFILRIEDTDFERSTEEMVGGILDGMKLLGLDWDEGPFFQSKRMELYRANAERLITTGHAYYCFCSKEQLEKRRAAAQSEGRAPMYERVCRGIPREEAARRKAAGEAAAIRFAVPEGSTWWEDAVFGKVEFANAEIEDFVLLRSDGVPTYHLSVVTDDVDMRMTHIIRGADHISNTPKQILQYNALGAAMPTFAHVPLILGPDKTRLSKRHGATSVVAYRDEGIIPEAFRNYLSLLGWTPGQAAGREIFTQQELVSLFGLEGISRSNAVFDRAKLDWYNSEYIRAYSAEQLLPLVEAEWKKAGLVPQNSDPAWLRATIDLLKPRARNLRDFATIFRAFFTDDYANDPAAIDKFLKERSVREMLGELAGRYASSNGFTEQSAEQTLRDFAAEKNVKAGALINGARVALTGQAVAPSLFAVMTALGKEKTVKRLDAARNL